MGGTMAQQDEACTHDCGSCGVECASREGPQSFLEAANPLSRVGKVIGVVSGKGGVGKSLVTSLLATAMGKRGYKVGVLDADITGPSVPKVFGVKGPAKSDGASLYPVRAEGGTDVMSINLLLEHETDPVIWRGPMIAGVVKQFWTDVVWDVDFLFVDMPPGTGDVALTVFQSLPVDGVVIVTSPQELVALVVEKSLNMARTMKIPVLGLVENMSYLRCPDCGKNIALFGESKIAETAARFSLPVLGRIPLDPPLAALCDAGRIEQFDGDYLDGAASAVESMDR